MLGPFLRRKAYWIGDGFRRPSVRSQLEDLEGQLSDGSKASAVRRERLENLLPYAAVGTAWCRNCGGCTDLAQFPVILKRQISRQRAAFESSAFAGPQLPVMSTSGSTGMPVQFRLSPLKRCRQRADMMINRVNEIPAPRSGNRPYVINEYLKESLRGGSCDKLQRFQAMRPSLR